MEGFFWAFRQRVGAELAAHRGYYTAALAGSAEILDEAIARARDVRGAAHLEPVHVLALAHVLRRPV